MVVLGYATNAAEAATNAATTAVENAMNIAINTTAAYCVDNTSQVWNILSIIGAQTSAFVLGTAANLTAAIIYLRLTQAEHRDDQHFLTNGTYYIRVNVPMFIAQNGTVYPHQEMNVGITAGPTHVERMPDNEYRLTSTLAPVSTLTVNILRISRPMAFSNDPQLTPTNIKMHRIISFLDRHSENRWYKPIIPRVIRFFRRHRYKYQFKLQCSSVLCTNYLHQTNGGTEIFADRGSADDASIFIFEPSVHRINFYQQAIPNGLYRIHCFKHQMNNVFRRYVRIDQTGTLVLVQTVVLADIFTINHNNDGTIQIRTDTCEAVVQGNVLLFVPPQPGNPVAPPFEIYELVKARNGIAQLRVNGMFLDYNANQNPNNPIQIDLAAAVWPIYELTKFVFIPI